MLAGRQVTDLSLSHARELLAGAVEAETSSPARRTRSVAPGRARSRPLLRDSLDRGGVLAIPTESSYGLAADPGTRKGSPGSTG